MRLRTLVYGILLPILALTPLQAQPPESVPPLPAAVRGDNEVLDLSRLAPFQRVVYLSARRGAEWLWQANRPDGLFVPGHRPALQLTIEEENGLHQAGAAWALARAARFMESDRFGVRARQAVLTLLAGAAPEAEDKNARALVNVNTAAERIVASASLVLAIHDLPAPGDDLLDQAEQLCNFLRKRQQPDGGLLLDDADPHVRAMAPLAVYAVARSQRLRPAEWKGPWVAKGVNYWKIHWQEREHAAQAPYVALAAGECACAANDQELGDFTLRICDALGRQQHGLDPRHPLWQGGFKAPGAISEEPSVSGAINATALAMGCRVARAFQRTEPQAAYRDAVERHLQFLTTLQFLPTNVKHFAENYKPSLIGAFHATHQDGTLRIEHNQVAILAMLDYLEFVAPIPKG